MAPVDSRTQIGHVHLKVADIERSLDFYVGVLGFELQQRMGDQAAFISAGGYHHHIGLNTWQSRGGSPPPPGHDGPLPRRDPLSRPRRRSPTRCAGSWTRAIRSTGASDHGVSEAIYLNDPDGNGVELYRDRPERSGRATPTERWRWSASRSTSKPCSRRLRMPRGYMEGPAADEAERRLDELERAPEKAPEERLRRLRLDRGRSRAALPRLAGRRRSRRALRLGRGLGPDGRSSPGRMPLQCRTGRRLGPHAVVVAQAFVDEARMKLGLHEGSSLSRLQLAFTVEISAESTVVPCDTTRTWRKPSSSSTR